MSADAALPVQQVLPAPANAPPATVNEAEIDTDGCRSLWVAVLRKAAEDLAFQTAAARGEIDAQRHAKQLREIDAEDPMEFIEGPWFTVICDLLGVDPGVAKRLFELEAAGSVGAKKIADQSRKAA